MTPLAAVLFRDMRIAVRVGGGALMGVLFFLVVVTLVPFAVGPDLALLKRIGPAILWLAALLASLLALDRLFAVDHEDGSLDLILMRAVEQRHHCRLRDRARSTEQCHRVSASDERLGERAHDGLHTAVAG